MLTKMEVFTPGVITPPLPIVEQGEILDPIQITDVQGLGPVKATVNTDQYGSVDGEYFTGSSTPKRNIILTIALNPDWALGQTYEGLRQILYTYFMPENQVTLRFTSTHLAQVEIVGYVESCEPDIFSKDPQYQISIICPQPYFTAVNATVVTGTTQAIAGAVNVPVTYEGNADTGFILDLTQPSGTAFNGEVRILNNTPTTKISIISGVVVSTAQFFRWSSVQGDKYVRQYPLPSGAYTNALGKVTPGSAWLTLRKGVNQMQILSATAGLSWAISYYAKYGGL